MQTRREFLLSLAISFSLARFSTSQPTEYLNLLDPRGMIHIPIGIGDTLDTLKTFVEAEGNFSPGFGSYGIYVWVFNTDSGKLTAPTMPDVHRSHGLDSQGLLIPWTRWKAGDVEVKTEVCEIRRSMPEGDVFIVGSRANVTNVGNATRNVVIYAALRPLGPAGFDVHHLELGDRGDALLVDGITALVAEVPSTKAGVSSKDNIGRWALAGKVPLEKSASSASGDCSGALTFELALRSNETKSIGFLCPVLPGRRAARHEWVDLKGDAMVDVAVLNPPTGGILQPDLGLPAYRSIRPSDVFREASDYWSQMVERINIKVPDRRWGESMRVILSHASLCMNEGAPDVAVINYNVFNRDAIYVANMMQKSGMTSLAKRALDYLLAHPFNGRPYPEADNPGQVLWALCQEFLFTRDGVWLEQVYPAVQKLAALITYYRTTRGPHWVDPTSLDFGSALPVHKREELQAGRCDGFHPEYTEAFDIAGLQAAAVIAGAIGNGSDASAWTATAESLWKSYDEKFGSNLGREYGSYSVLWPCRLYPLSSGKAYERFRGVGTQKPESWRYFPLATAHQSLLAGNREAGYETLERHLDHPQMQGWYAFDEGGESGTGGWQRVRTKWPRSVSKPADNLSVAMPHGWAIAEFWHLMRDCFVFEDGERLILFAGLPARWFEQPEEIVVNGLQTYFGVFSFTYNGSPQGGMLRLSGSTSPPQGFVLRWPKDQKATLTIGGKSIDRDVNGDFFLPSDTREVLLSFPD